LSRRNFALSVHDDLAEIVDAYERADDVIARQLVYKLRDWVAFVVTDTGWLAQRAEEHGGDAR
jgi:hypothetical protein